MRIAMLLPVMLLLSAVSGARDLPSAGLQEACPRYPRPDHTDHAKMARWLVHSLNWGTVSTLSRHLGGAPFGNPLSYADGPRCGPATGRLLFFLSPMDATMQDLARNTNASLTLHELQLPGACPGVDPEDPTCVKLTLTGTLEPVPEEGLQKAQRLLFSRHPDMHTWPEGHSFRIHELHLRAARILTFYGGPTDLTPEQYFGAELDPDETQQLAAA